jgi:hypothetical protein
MKTIYLVMVNHYREDYPLKAYLTRQKAEQFMQTFPLKFLEDYGTYIVEIELEGE